MKPLYLLLLSLALLLFAGCGKMPENGDLDGLWQLVEMHSKADPTDPQYSHYTDKRAEKVRWAFQLQLLSMKSFDLLPGTDTNEAVARKSTCTTATATSSSKTPPQRSSRPSVCAAARRNSA